MKRTLVALILCAVLSVSALSFAEQYPQEAMFDGFAVSLDRVEHSGGKLTIRLMARFASEADAKYFGNFTLLPQDTQGEKPRYFTPEEVGAFYEGFLAGIQVFSSSGEPPRRLTPEEIAEHYPAGYTPYPDRAFILSAFKTLSGEDFAPDGSFDMLEYGTHQEPEIGEDGEWYLPVLFEAAGFSTVEDGVKVEFSIHDPIGGAPYAGEVEQTLFIPLQ